MKIISETQLNFPEIVQDLQAGETLVYPTETCYGLGCDGTNTSAVEKVFAIKGRDTQKPCILLFQDVETLKKYAVLDPYLEEKISLHWPGALTVVLPAKENTDLSPLVISIQGKIACRISPHPLVKSLLEIFHKPLVSTSANIAGAPNIYNFEEIQNVFGGRDPAPDRAIDAGTLAETPPSTLIEEVNGTIQVLRQGSVKI